MVKTPANNGRDGKELTQVTNKGDGMSKSGSGGGGAPMSKFHMRPSAGMNTEYSAVCNKGDGMSK